MLIELQAESKPANAFQEELYSLNPCDRKKTLNNQFSQRKRHKRELSSQETPYKSPVDKGEQVLKVDLKGRVSCARSKENITRSFSEKCVFCFLGSISPNFLRQFVGSITLFLLLLFWLLLEVHSLISFFEMR